MLAVIFISIIAAGCSNDLLDNSEKTVAKNTVPSDIRNTKWVGQGAQSNIRLDIGTDGINVSGAGAQWDGWCGYGGYGYGCCAFRYNNGPAFTWQYTRQGNTLSVWNSTKTVLNGQWTRLE